MSSTESWKTNFIDFLKGRGKIQQLGELTAVQHMKAMASQTERNSEAEAAFVRQKAWGETQPSAASGEQDTMGNTILGDINQPPAVVYPPQQNNNTLAALALAMAGLVPVGIGAAGAGAAAAYLLKPDNAAVQPQPEYEDTTVSIGLKRLEDFDQE